MKGVKKMAQSEEKGLIQELIQVRWIRVTFSFVCAILAWYIFEILSAYKLDEVQQQGDGPIYILFAAIFYVTLPWLKTLGKFIFSFLFFYLITTLISNAMFPELFLIPVRKNIYKCLNKIVLVFVRLFSGKVDFSVPKIVLLLIIILIFTIAYYLK